MNRFKGTPAPWRPATMGPNGCPIVGSKTTMVAMLAHSVNEYDQAEQAKANAHLIAAAPELLESLRELVSAMVRYEIDAGESAPVKHENMMNKARAAIAKALGEIK